MGAAYPQALRNRVLSACDRGMKTKQVANLFEVSSSWVRRVKQRRRENGETSPRPCGGATVIKIDLDQLASLVRKHPDATIKELHALLDVDCVVSAVGVALKRLGLTLKKRPFMRRNKTGRTSPVAALPGSVFNLASMPSASFSSMKRGPRRT